MRQDYKVLIFPFLFLCATSTYFAYAFFYSSISIATTKNETTLEVINSDKNQSRGIASISNSQRISIDCQATNSVQAVDTEQVFIKFENCDELPITAELKLINTTNQYMAQLFHPMKGAITTDFIQLAKGENILKFEISLIDKQKKTQIIKIDRILTENQ